MARQSMVSINTKKHDAMVRRLIKKHRLNMFYVLAETIDTIRLKAATDYIIPTNPEADLYRNRISRSQQRKLQPTHPFRLTSRTGLLVAMLKEKTSRIRQGWIFKTRSSKRDGFSYITAKSASLNTAAFKGRIKVLQGLGTDSESYLATLSVSITSTKPQNYTKRSIDLTADENALFRSRVAKIGRNKHRPETPDSIRARFRHEKGMRHVRPRPFIGPAIDDTKVDFRTLVRNKVNELSRYR